MADERQREAPVLPLKLASLLILSLSFPVPCAFSEERVTDDPHGALKTAGTPDVCVEGESGPEPLGGIVHRSRFTSESGGLEVKGDEVSCRRTSEAAYEEAMEEEREACETARESLTEEAKTTYELAKERLSQATGDLGAEMLRRAVMGVQERLPQPYEAHNL